ncbi:MAG: PIG-L family deacetylase [Limnochordia bacterium]|jgi:LmbE family N-acetylglucosaminyl deacetylase|nr:PIG-L family deacetylase [Limnochordia bacterium]MDD2629850.1 PIG-L family deacetylase [Limnochordia bacterium]MDD4518894.1 PIG-L family deacetylase [Limnochordia bacterium]
MRVLAISCHPDDVELTCAGTLARYKEQGHDVFVCHVANGNLGHAVIPPDELRSIRSKEAKVSASMIGAEVITCDIGDLLVYEGQREQRDKVVDVIRNIQPDVIITHSPTDYMPDHLAVSRLVFDATFAASVSHYQTKVKSSAALTPIYYMDTLAGVNFNPTEYVDITSTIELKLQMLAVHESQIKWMQVHDNIDFLEFVRTCARFRGLQCGVGYAEAFTQCHAWPRLTTKRLLP